MHIRFADRDEDFIKAQVQNGFYSNETELVRDAVRRMREEKERAARFNAAVLQGAKDIAEGRTTPLTPELMQELVQSGIDRAKERKKG
jgi:antitoxin ParD1/3/4